MIDSLVIHTPKEKKMKKAKEMENRVREREFYKKPADFMLNFRE